jgi:hypothetical protein
MNDVTQICERPSKPQKLRCVICGSTVEVERHHVGGRNHVPRYTNPLCRKHHLRVTAAIRGGGIDMRYTSDKRVRLVRALMATAVFVWTLLDELMQEFEQERTEQQ